MNDKVKKFHDALDDVLDRPIAYNPAFRRITGSTVAGIFLSQAWYWSKRHKEDDGWFYKTGKEWEEETGLTRSEQETARKHCLRVGVMEEKLKGIPATMYYKVVKSQVYTLLGLQFVDIPQTNQNAGNQQSDGGSNINKVTESSPMIPTEISEEEEELKSRAETLKVFYESSVGPITALVMDKLEKAAQDYPDAKWYHPAFEIMKEKADHRSWGYVESILKNWKEHYFGWKPGDDKRPGKKQSVAQSGDHSKYTSGAYSEYIA
jgi:DnaD/phage-associated family protein